MYFNDLQNDQEINNLNLLFVNSIFCNSYAIQPHIIPWMSKDVQTV